MSDQNVVKIGVKIATHLSVNASTYVLHTRDIFFDRKKQSCPERAYIANGHIFSHQQSDSIVTGNYTRFNNFPAFLLYI